MTERPALTPVNLITGFLGSGKTTLLQRLLRDPALADTAVLINEFGEVGLDHHLLERVDETMVLLQSGCLCCTIRGELSSAIKDLHSRREVGRIPFFRRLVIESTGLADPFPILSTVHADPVLKHHFRLGNVIATVDAVNGGVQLARQQENAKQVAVADRLVITKTDLADEAAVEMLIPRIRQLNPLAPLWRVPHDPLDAEGLLSHEEFELAGRSERAQHWFATALMGQWRLNRYSHASGDVEQVRSPRASGKGGAYGPEINCHADSIHAFALVFEKPLDWTVFGIWLTMLLNRHGPRILRVKGILNVTGSPAPVAVHGVQHLVHPPVHMASWPDEDRRSRIVFIVDGLDRAIIERSLSAFLHTNGCDWKQP
ncbi:CobW family GTP-binding protein [Microvirga makkahensis]|uniref:GTP-binding protein n=1 Tax=Microvirga makkahensis TaxID=1128670 RepID=A0A7X3SN82_9HYPH|nr:GTP-binding protein [Microvirga makkahensis]MXQ10789.1 GTP-binding protein [Microvirga makkahensis]